MTDIHLLIHKLQHRMRFIKRLLHALADDYNEHLSYLTCWLMLLIITAFISIVILGGLGLLLGYTIDELTPRILRTFLFGAGLFGLMNLLAALSSQRGNSAIKMLEKKKLDND